MDLTKVARQNVLIPDSVSRIRFEETLEFVVYVISENSNIVTPDIGEYYDELSLGSIITRRGNELIILNGYIYNYEDDNELEDTRFIHEMKSVYLFTLTLEQADNYGYRFSPLEELKENAGFMEELNATN